MPLLLLTGKGGTAAPPAIVTLLHDTFAGANGANVHGRTPDTAGSNTWAALNGSTFDIQSNRANSTNAPAAPFSVMSYDVGEADYEAIFTFFAGAGSGARPGVRVNTSTLDYYFVLIAPSLNTMTIFEYTHPGGFTSRASASITNPAADTDLPITITVSGDTIEAEFDGITVAYNSATVNNTSTVLVIGGTSIKYNEIEVSA